MYINIYLVINKVMSIIRLDNRESLLPFGSGIPATCIYNK